MSHDLRTAFETIVLARVASSSRGSSLSGPRRETTELLDALDRHAAERGTEAFVAYAHAMRAAYDRFGAHRTFGAMAPLAWRALVDRAPLRAREEWCRVWDPMVTSLEALAREPEDAPPARPTAARPASKAPARAPTAAQPASSPDEDTPWWLGWGPAEIASWLAEVRAAHCDVVWSDELGRPRVLELRGYTPPWVASDAFQLRALLTEHLRPSARKAA